MTRPFKHPKTGFYWIRKRVPLDLQALVGKREEKFSLKTRDLNEAKKSASRLLIEIEERWASLKRGTQTLSEREAYSLAEELFHLLVQQHSDTPEEMPEWDVKIGDDLWKTVLPEDVDWTAGDRLLAQFVPTKPFERMAMISRCERTADAILLRRGLMVDEEGRQRLVRATASALQHATLECRAAGKATFHASAMRPSMDTRRHAGRFSSNEASPVSLIDLYNGWEKESSSTERTRYAWKRVVDELIRHLGHSRADDIRQPDLVGWKDSLLEANLAAKTIKDGKLAPIRAIIEWGVKNGKLDANVAARVTISVRQKPGESKRGYDDDQAHRILQEALRQNAPGMHWIPWICATTGARVSEVSQLRKTDIFLSDNVVCIRISPEAGSIKNISSERDIPAHSVLLALGFLDFVAKVADGAPMFPDMGKDRFGNRGGTASKRIGAWVRSLGIIDKRLSPSHAWRHRFSSLARDFNVDPVAQPALTGHSQKTIAGRYGAHKIPYLKRELEKIPVTAFIKPGV